MKDWKRDNSVKIRNTHPSVSLHDVVKTLLVRIIRRQNPNLNAVDIYTEHNAQTPNLSYPDIFVNVHNRQKRVGKKTSAKENNNYIWEIQEKWSQEWEDKILKQYKDDNLTIVKLNQICEYMELNHSINLKNIIDKLNEILERDYTCGRLS